MNLKKRVRCQLRQVEKQREAGEWWETDKFSGASLMIVPTTNSASKEERAPGTRLIARETILSSSTLIKCERFELNLTALLPTTSAELEEGCFTQATPSKCVQRVLSVASFNQDTTDLMRYYTEEPI